MTASESTKLNSQKPSIPTVYALNSKPTGDSDAAATKMRALEKLKAARMRLARAGVTSSAEHIRKASLAAKVQTTGEKRDGLKQSDGTGKENTITGPEAIARESYSGGDTSTSGINKDRKRPLEVDGRTTEAGSSKKRPGIEYNDEKSGNGNRPNQHRNATKVSAAPPPVNKKFEKYIDYDFSKIKDTSGGFFNEDLDKSFEELQEKKELEMEARRTEQKLSLPPVMLGEVSTMPVCSECGSKDLDFKLYNVFGIKVCKCCREALPEKYSLLTKTEVKEDYLLTDSELRDTDLFPRLEKPNPHKTTFNNMMLFLRSQVEEYSYKKWGGPEGLDEEYEKRVDMKKKRKEKKLMKKMEEMRRKTKATGGYAMTEQERNHGRHEHEWSSAISVENAQIPGTVQRRCAICGLTTEEVLM